MASFEMPQPSTSKPAPLLLHNFTATTVLLPIDITIELFTTRLLNSASLLVRVEIPDSERVLLFITLGALLVLLLSFW